MMRFLEFSIYFPRCKPVFLRLSPPRAWLFCCLQEITKEAEKAIEEELEKLSSLEKNSPEFNGTKSYLDWLTQLPWGHASVDNFDLKKAKHVLDEVTLRTREPRLSLVLVPLRGCS